MAIRITSGRTEIEIDATTGLLLRVADTRGRVHFDATPDPARLGRLFRIFLPLPDWVSHHAERSTSPPQIVDERGGRLTLRYADLTTPRGPAGVEASITFEPAPNDEIHLTLTLVSDRDGNVTDVMFPWLGGWVPGATGKDRLVVGGVRDVDLQDYPRPERDPVGRWNQRDYWSYPRDVACPWLDASTRDGGVGVVSYQRAASILGVFVENLAGYEPGLEMSVGMAHYPRIRRGERWQSPPIAIVAHEGNWRSTADRYSAWVDTWFKPPPTPDWARTAIGVQNVHFRFQDGSRAHRFREIPDLVRAGLAYGVPHLTVWDLGIMGPVPDFMTPWVPLSDDDRDELRVALAAARTLGGHVSLVENHRILWPGSDFFRDVGRAELALRYDGTPYVEQYLPSQWHPAPEAAHVGTMTHILDPRAPGYRERVLATVEDRIGLGFDSIHWDQPHMEWPSYRHDVRGQPYDVHPATVALLHEVRELLHEHDPASMMIGEWGDVFASEAIDLWFPSWLKEPDDLERAAYAVPQALWSCVIDSDPALATRAFGFGAQLFLITRGLLSTLADVPEFGAHVKALAGLKQRGGNRLVRARLRGSAGLEISGDGPASAATFVGPTGPAIVLASPAAKGRLRIELDREALREMTPGWGDVASAAARPTGQLHRFDGSTEDTHGDVIDVELSANEAAIWYP